MKAPPKAVAWAFLAAIFSPFLGFSTLKRMFAGPPRRLDGDAASMVRAENKAGVKSGGHRNQPFGVGEERDSTRKDDVFHPIGAVLQ